jgi:oligopeptide transport system permease protein
MMKVFSSSHLWKNAWSRLFQNQAALWSGVVLCFIISLAIFMPLLVSHNYAEIYWDSILIPPNWEKKFYFGTDFNGRDLFSRTLIGARISLIVAFVASSVSLAIGLAYGTLSGYLGGRIDGIMMRFVDILYTIPFMFFVIVLTVFFGRHIFLIFIAIGAVEWLDMARVVRGQTLSLKRKEFVEAAIASGASSRRIISHHIIPNLLGTVIIYLTLTIPRVILIESFLSFLGLGIQEPLTSWGALISEGATQMETAPWALIFPSLFLSATLISLNFMGDGIRDALDPKDR